MAVSTSPYSWATETRERFATSCTVRSDSPRRLEQPHPCPVSLAGLAPRFLIRSAQEHGDKEVSSSYFEASSREWPSHSLWSLNLDRVDIRNGHI